MVLTTFATSNRVEHKTGNLRLYIVKKLIRCYSDNLLVSLSRDMPISANGYKPLIHCRAFFGLKITRSCNLPKKLTVSDAGILPLRLYSIIEHRGLNI
jgi:hypothetical protein